MQSWWTSKVGDIGSFGPSSSKQRQSLGQGTHLARRRKGALRRLLWMWMWL